MNDASSRTHALGRRARVASPGGGGAPAGGRTDRRPPWRWLDWGQRGTAGAAIPSALGLEGIRQVFGEVVALDGVSLTVAPGEILCLLGHSGCGKTTLLRIAAGVERPVEGRVVLDGREVAGPSRFVPPEQRGVGLMFQDYALFPHLTILQNVMFGLKRLPPPEAEEAASRALARVGLGHYADDYPHMLSGGEQQRVALARAIAPRPGILLMDEPFSNLDRRMRDGVREETVALLRETGATAVVVTHDPEEAMRIADRIVLMRAGRIVQGGTAEELYRRPQSLFAARFFCDFNEIKAIVQSGRVDTPLGAFAAPGLSEGTEAVVCIRPQGIRIMPSGIGAAGRVISRCFLGEVDLVEVVAAGLDKPLHARVRECYEAAVGEDVGVEVMPDEVLVFAAAGA
ncbi:ABC transporter ATP-binding protein [Chelatococcus sp. SYSU_G07232]|uniref:ABC transporter ATP-binding protein n=1 Tax=Chelatococcus albus TaxID=3047466 RepID=A0ABT7AE87_9HYPH|nr:ABC transporter ATP-binding protein [Chelatococcus sp. SYSU_G07232]MDJ1157134.1 ABC transporter ATP-binding protein [Chelatococcus sp. SYSU_G07232]